MKRKKKMGGSALLWGLFFEKLLQNVDASVMVTNSRGHVVFANRRYLDFFSFSEKDIVGKHWITNVIPGARRRSVKKIFDDIKRKKTLGRFDTPVLIAGKLGKYIHWIGIPLKDKRTFFYMFIGREEKYLSRLSVKMHAATRGKLDTTYKEVVNTLFQASMVSEPDTARHAVRVMVFAVGLARKLKMSKERIERLKVAALLHDLGKLAVDGRILFKKGKLTASDIREIRKHPRLGSEVVRFVYFLRDIIPIMVNHHENYDGGGYPCGIKGEDIPLEARILCVADIYEALTAERPYRKRFSMEEAIRIMEMEKGLKLDPGLTDIFLDIVKKGGFREEDS
ncbi:MAG: hypothetical protein DRP85_03625 [Candidatus Makaraimicrobium thalassicum]|nr:MAG: hypothetical protein DRP85_03625 [Candidatus Omnitrophota bacterium]